MMTRTDDTRAASLAIALSPPLEATTTVAAALASPTQEAPDVIVVARRGRLIGGLTREELERAAAFGLDGLQLSDLLVADLQVVAPDASPASIRKTLNAGPTPFVVVRASGREPSGFIDRRRLASVESGEEGWSHLPGSDAAGVRSALRRCTSASALAALEELGRRAASSGGRACLVGGVVRDLLLGRATRDLDVIVEGDLRTLQCGLGREKKTHSRFLTATRVLEDGTAMDVAHARSEQYAHPAALPQVESATVAEDLARRDFTINTLALSLEPGRFGSVLDLCGAMEDLGQRRIRVLHGLLFVDDPTRAFRAVRLAARLEFEIERRTAHSIELALGQGIFDRLSPCRLRREVELLLLAADFPRSIRLAARYGLLQVLSQGMKLPPRARTSLDRAAKAMAWYEGLQRGEAFSERRLLCLQGSGGRDPAHGHRLRVAPGYAERDPAPSGDSTRDPAGNRRSRPAAGRGAGGSPGRAGAGGGAGGQARRSGGRGHGATASSPGRGRGSAGPRLTRLTLFYYP